MFIATSGFISRNVQLLFFLEVLVVLEALQLVVVLNGRVGITLVLSMAGCGVNGLHSESLCI